MLSFNYFLLQVQAEGQSSMDQERAHQSPGDHIVPTGSHALDQALGIGGIPYGQITEIVGPPNVGKTALSLQILVEAQRLDESGAYIAGASTLTAASAREHGLNPNTLLIKQPASFKEALDTAEALVDEDKVGLLVIDNLVLLPLHSSTEDHDDPIGERARRLAHMVRRLRSALLRKNTAVVFLTSTRWSRDLWVGAQAAPGGHALKFYAGIRLSLSPAGPQNPATDSAAHIVVARVLKNRLAPPPYAQAHLNIHR
jgi:recombination protein RecA